MSEYTENAPEKIDLTNLLRDTIRGIQKLWWIMLALVVGFGLKAYFDVSYSYVPQYIASATTSIQSGSGGSSYVDQTTAEQMADIFPYIMRSGVLQNAILEDLGLEYMPGSISMSVEDGTNFFTVSASASDPQVAYELLQATLRQYPQVAEFAVGRITMTVLDETGIPKNTGKESVIRGSVRNGAFKGMILGLILLAVYVLSRNTVQKSKELKRIVNLEDLGSVPKVREKKRRKRRKSVNLLLSQEHISQSYVEAIRKVRFKIMKEMELHAYGSLLVTSSIPGEGKTTLAVNLAISMAQQGKKVVLVDCDVRNPSIAGVFNDKKKHPGVAAVLRKEVPLHKAISTVEVKGAQLQVIFGSEPDAGAVSLLGTDRMGRLMDALKQYADVVILDTAPSQLLADASALARHVDAAVYVVRCDYTKKWRIRSGVQSLGESGIKILGYIFNAENARWGGGYGYGYGYRSYGGHYASYYGYKSRRTNGEDASGRVTKD